MRELWLPALQTVIQTAVTVAIGVASGYAARLFSTVQKKTQHNKVGELAWRFVLAAEQKFNAAPGSAKKIYVMTELRKLFPKVPETLLDAAAEAAVAQWLKERQLLTTVPVTDGPKEV